MFRKIITLLLSLAALIALANYFIFGVATPPIETARQSTSAENSFSHDASSTIANNLTPPAVNISGSETDSDDDNFDRDFVARLQAHYGDGINDIAVQASLISEQEYVIERFPENGERRFENILRMAFPELADQILSVLKRLYVYRDWLIENQTALAEMGPLENNGTLWQKRRELFGKDADLIWTEDSQLMAEKRHQMQTSLERLRNDHDLSYDEKLYQLQAAIDETYADALQTMVVQPGLIAQVFFDFESVQQELQSLSAEDRQQQINATRRHLGFSEEQIELNQQRDEARNARWENGLEYMAARQQLTASLEGPELDEAIAALQLEHFKHEAKTIAIEEQSEFFRYQRRRVYGRN